ncbi:MAG: hypothetical protein E7311_04160 [Clostridiales bacterium]|nr:hypothetical protein [Clostridiales bacterium]
MKKFILGFAVGLVICGIAFSVFIIINKKEIPINNDEVIIANNKENENNDREEHIIKEEASETEKNELVYSLYKYKDSEGNELYSIPYININSEEANKINKEIEEFYKSEVEEAIKEIEEYSYAFLHEVSYNFYINDNILSLVILKEYDWDIVYYGVYNLDINKGTIVTNSEIISNIKGIDEDIYLDILKDICKQRFIEAYGEKEEWKQFNAGEEYETQLNRTISEDNLSIQTPIFLNDKGNIAVIANIYSLAGGDSYYRRIDTNL